MSPKTSPPIEAIPLEHLLGVQDDSACQWIRIDPGSVIGLPKTLAEVTSALLVALPHNIKDSLLNSQAMRMKETRDDLVAFPLRDYGLTKSGAHQGPNRYKSPRMRAGNNFTSAPLEKSQATPNSDGAVKAELAL